MNKDDSCEVYGIDKKIVKNLKTKLLPHNTSQQIADSFKILGDPTRVKILDALAHKELCVCDLTLLLTLTQSAISHQLGVLRSYNLVKFRKEGKFVYYSLSDNHIMKLMDMVTKHATE
ncbi:MAG: ArsR/SmtB family transcription factor [Candidatus Bilamarchaeum sp.]|jgi:ArsR family transcriptional regulator